MGMIGRRALLLAAAAAPFAGARLSFAIGAQNRFSELEAATNGRLGVAALNTADGAQVTHRADERFAFCSTFKMMVASAVLKRSEAESGLLEQRISYTKEELVTYSPVTAKHTGEGMTVSELCAAALQYSDNTAANLLIKVAGGTAAVTAFARSIGDNEFRLDRFETELNSAIPGDPRDTTTPAAMRTSLQRIALGDALGAPQRERLVDWMRGNTTGAKRIRAGVPAPWQVADRTGTGDYGTTNAIGVLWPPRKAPIVLVVYFTQRDKGAPMREDVVASAARIVAEALG